MARVVMPIRKGHPLIVHRTPWPKSTIMPPYLTRNGRSAMNKISRILLGVTLLGLWATPRLAQTNQELINDGRDGKNTENVLTHSMGYDRKSYSPLNQINKTNVKRLVPVWNASVANDQ